MTEKGSALYIHKQASKSRCSPFTGRTSSWSTAALKSPIKFWSCQKQSTSSARSKKFRANWKKFMTIWLWPSTIWVMCTSTTHLGSLGKRKLHTFSFTYIPEPEIIAWLLSKRRSWTKSTSIFFSTYTEKTTTSPDPLPACPTFWGKLNPFSTWRWFMNVVSKSTISWKWWWRSREIQTNGLEILWWIIN